MRSKRGWPNFYNKLYKIQKKLPTNLHTSFPTGGGASLSLVVAVAAPKTDLASWNPLVAPTCACVPYGGEEAMPATLLVVIGRFSMQREYKINWISAKKLANLFPYLWQRVVVPGGGGGPKGWSGITSPLAAPTCACVPYGGAKAAPASSPSDERETELAEKLDL